MSAMNIDRALDDIVKENRKAHKNRRSHKNRKSNSAARPSGDVTMTDAPGATRPAGGVGKKRGKGRKLSAGSPAAAAAAAAAAASASAANGQWPHDKFKALHANASPAGGATGAKIVVSNLDYKVSTQDIQELFGSVGPVAYAVVLTDSAGKSKGSAEVVFVQRNDALTAIQKYHGVPLDNRPLKISLVTGSLGQGGDSGKAAAGGLAAKQANAKPASGKAQKAAARRQSKKNRSRSAMEM